jgi:ribose/xylose/arabinose/galactoside ABC-type transport system permease subunit
MMASPRLRLILADCPAARRPVCSRRFYVGLANAVAMEIGVALLIAALVLAAPSFATWGNLLNILRTVSIVGIIAFGMTAVIVVGEIDLSVGSGIAFAGCIAAWLCAALTPGAGAPVAVLVSAAAALGIGILTGWLAGTVRHRLGVPSFVTTLALLAALRGGANIVTGGFPLTTFPASFSLLGAGTIGGMPVSVLLLIGAGIGMHVLLQHTRFGRDLYAVGGNAEAARLAGIDVFRTKTTAFMLLGGLTALSGLVTASQIGAGSGTAGGGMELDAIAAVIIGGTSLAGGRGSIRGTALGVLLLGCLANGMTLMGVSEYWQYVVRAAVILAAVAAYKALERLH